jgi:L-ascorbate metabolism protein UlaG (beta-lactamase superfamily)
MKLQLIRSATLRLTYAGHTLLIDPCLAAKGAYDPLVGKARNPMADLPLTVEQVLDGVEMTVVSHLHRDHFDAVAMDVLPKDMPLYCQPGNEDFIAGKGFGDVRVIEDTVTWNGIEIQRTTGRHGSGIWAEKMGKVSGFVFRAPGEPVVYWAGDTIWYEPVQQVVADVQPDVIITHSCGAEFEAGSPIVMDAAQTVAVCRAAPGAVVVAVHMDAYDHSTVSRADLRAYTECEGISPAQLLIPADGETLRLNS